VVVVSPRVGRWFLYQWFPVLLVMLCLRIHQYLMFVYLKLSGSLRVRSCLPVAFSSVCFNHVHVHLLSLLLSMVTVHV
jgi:hypothetical protein